MVQKDRMCNEYGMSCVEDYVLYLLNCKILNWQKCFYKSYKSFEEILVKMVIENQEYSRIDFIERIQKTLSEDGILQIRYVPLESLKDIEVGEYFLLQVNEQSTKELFNAVTWRDDHFILVYKIMKDTFEIFNDRPFVSSIYSWNELKTIAKESNGTRIQFLNCNIDSIVNSEKVKILKEQLEKCMVLDREEINLSTIKIRDSVGIYKIVVRRLEAFLETFGEGIGYEYSKRLDNLYLKLEYMNKKNREDIKTLNKAVDETIDLQVNLKRTALERVEKIYERLK